MNILKLIKEAVDAREDKLAFIEELRDYLHPKRYNEESYHKERE